MALTQVEQSMIVQPVVTYGPAFVAYLGSNQTVSSAVHTKLQINTEVFDTNNCFDIVNYRFVPTQAGYYEISGKGSTLSTTSASVDIMSIYKNGALYLSGPANYSTTTNGLACAVSGLVYLNGSTDYVELFGYNGGSGTNTFYGGPPLQTCFMGFLARPA